MLKKLFDLVTGERRRTKQVIATLDDFLTNAQNSDLSYAQAQKNLEEGVIELVKYGKHYSNGLLITDDGYFLTARHCFEHSLPQQVRLYDGSKYPFEKVCYQDSFFDIAVAKAAIPGYPRSRKYRIYRSEEPIILDSPIIAISRRNAELIGRFGVAIGQGFLLDDDIPHIIEFGREYGGSLIRAGDSGGVLITPDAKILGIISATGTDILQRTKIMWWRSLKEQMIFEYDIAININVALKSIYRFIANKGLPEDKLCC